MLSYNADSLPYFSINMRWAGAKMMKTVIETERCGPFTVHDEKASN